MTQCRCALIGLEGGLRVATSAGLEAANAVLRELLEAVPDGTRAAAHERSSARIRLSFDLPALQLERLGQ